MFDIINEDNREIAEKFGASKDVKIEDLLNITSKSKDSETPLKMETVADEDLPSSPFGGNEEISIILPNENMSGNNSIASI